MNFQCKNCGANMVYAPELHCMHCEHCGSTDSHEKKGDRSLVVCASCGGEVILNPYTSATQCEYCGNYLIFDERVEGPYKPDSMIPFMVSKKQAVEYMKQEFKKRIFTPTSFLSEPTLKDLKGHYVPYFLYDYEAEADYEAEGTKIRRWTSGQYDYTETSVYLIKRHMKAAYDNIPADASYSMEDEAMDLVEPFHFHELKQFDPSRMSGFYGEIYNAESEIFEPRAKEKALNSARQLLQGSINGYSAVVPHRNDISINPGKVDYSLLPTWRYDYKYGGKTYEFYINGQNGKVVGETPVSRKKVVAYGATMGMILFGIVKIGMMLLEVL